jgi:hypothetical protein
MKMKPRTLLIILILLLSSVFFLTLINRVLYPSKAQSATKVNIFINEKTLECNIKGICIAHIFGATTAGNKLAGVQGQFTFSENLEVVAAYKDDFCNQASFGFGDPLNFAVNPTTHIVDMALGALKSNDQLTDGTKCITGVILKPKAGTTIPSSGKIALSDSSVWRAGGSSPLTAEVDTTPLVITINDTAPIPSITPPAGGSPTPTIGASCAKQSKGDCSCDSKIDMSDWELIRNSIRGEGKSCGLDFNTWIENNELIP